MGDCLGTIANSRLNELMSPDESARRVVRFRTALVALVAVATVTVAAVCRVVSDEPLSQPPVDAVFRLEGVGCKRNPTRTVGTVVSEPTSDGGQLVLTVAHGVVGQGSVIAVDGDRRVPMRLVAVDTEWDLAVLQASLPLLGSSGSPVGPVGIAEGQSGDAWFVVFEQAGKNRERQVTRSARVIRRLQINTEDIYLRDLTTRDARPGMEVHAETYVGDSGGPLFDPHGKLVGVVWGTSRKTKDRSWATRVQAATGLIESARSAAAARTNASSVAASLLACAP